MRMHHTGDFWGVKLQVRPMNLEPREAGREEGTVAGGVMVMAEYVLAWRLDSVGLDAGMRGRTRADAEGDIERERGGGEREGYHVPGPERVVCARASARTHAHGGKRAFCNRQILFAQGTMPAQRRAES